MILLSLTRKSCHLFKQYVNNKQILNRLRNWSTYSYLKSQEKTKQNLVIDLSFEDVMTTEECHRLAIDLYSVHLINSTAPEERQFKVNLCHQLSNNSLIIEYLSHYLPNLDDFHIHNNSYLNLFESQRLVYLSPDAKETIDFDSNDIYIIGGIVEKKIFRRDSSRLSHSKANREGIRTGRLPIDHLFSPKMRRGVVLFVPQVFGILCDVKCGESWEGAAHSHLPSWKLKPPALCPSNEDIILRKSSFFAK